VRECHGCFGSGEVELSTLTEPEIVAAIGGEAAEGFSGSQFNGWGRCALDSATHALVVTAAGIERTGLPPSTETQTGAEIAAEQDAQTLETWFDGEVYVVGVIDADGEIPGQWGEGMVVCGFIGYDHAEKSAVEMLSYATADMHTTAAEMMAADFAERIERRYWAERDVFTAELSA